MKYFLKTSKIRDKQIKFVKNQQKLFFEKQMGFVEEYKVMKYFDKIYDRIDEQFCKNVKRID
jgi:hypothetical protein